MLRAVDIKELEGGGPYYPCSRTLLLSMKTVPRDYLFCSLIVFSYVNCCCLGLFAVLCSIRSRDCKIVGDPEGATKYGKKARCLNIAAVILAILIIIVLIILIVTYAEYIYDKLQEALNTIHNSNIHQP